MGLGHGCRVQDSCRTKNEHEGNCNSRRKRRACYIQRFAIIQRANGISSKQQKSRNNRIGVSNGTRGGDGACDVHGEGTGGGDGMRGDGVGVGDIGEVHGVGRGEGDTAGGDDGRGAGRERDGGVVGGRGGRDERGAETEPGGDGVGVGDGTGHIEKVKVGGFGIE